MKKKNSIVKIGAALSVIFVLLLAGCASTGGGSTGPGKQAAASAAPVSSPVYYGSGSGATQTEAMNQAKIAAVRKASADLLGVAAAAAKRDEIETALFGKGGVNAYVYNDSMEIIDRGGSDGDFSLTLGIKINLESVAAVLRGAGIYGGQVLPQGGEVALVDQPRPAISAPQPATAEATPSAGQEEVPEEAPASTSGEIDPQEAALIQDIVGNLSYMVYYDEENVTDQFLATTAVGMANKYLAQNGMNYVDLEQIERLKKDQEMAYEEETGQSISMIQWIANKLNADIYIEIAVDANSETKSGRYYGSASVNLKNFDASTGSGRGTAYYQTVPPAMSTVSEKDALNNAVASATYNAVQKAIEQAQLYTRQELSQGIKYTLVIQNTPDSRMMRNFEKKIERKVKNIRKLSYAPEESRYEVRLIGRITDLEDLIYDATEGVSGMEGTFLVFQRGNSITFDTGL
ncbi:DUF6175 family protein [Sediminispirochaeta smaragdinae]|uniref:Lipoprotein n=1 Tax=Sediminispirochaeta smaragdinae (strain DSM 11293 / JCM 15392 / SEBR 4228) TaxID=573413 RepID=E1R921_SEDSS|nr:DUF6175 family protein [Sediminispirochaeta smaragdinae]ADK82990.1 conserved hypothetical protein [Sediminispirochaeta smaragdinae DSM 11293]